MDTVKAKKRGRPAQLLQVAELEAFIEYLNEKSELSRVESSFMDYLIDANYKFEDLSDVHQVLLKEALKPYREHLKLQLLFDELSKNSSHTEYERKFIQYYEKYQAKKLALAETNIMKVMCNRYQKFKAQQLEYKDLEFYLSQIQKKETGQQRRAENQRKFELGGAVLAAFKKLNMDISKDTPEQVTNRIINASKFHSQVRQSKVFSEIKQHENNYFEQNKLFIQVVDGFLIYSKDGTSLVTIEIKKSLDKNEK